ncbi:MAG: hypothetical protein EON59_17895, partial [Alphaproteobacteria bacterium]
MTAEQDPAEALASMRRARARATEIRRLPIAYHFAVGALMAGFVFAPGLGVPLVGAAVALLMLATVLLYHWQRHATGRFLNGYRPGRTMPIAILLTTILVGLLLTSHPGIAPTFNLFTPVQGALIAFVLATVLDWAWVR